MRLSVQYMYTVQNTMLSFLSFKITFDWRRSIILQIIGIQCQIFNPRSINLDNNFTKTISVK